MKTVLYLDELLLVNFALGAALLLGAVDREELLALPGGEKLARLLRLK